MIRLCACFLVVLIYAAPSWSQGASDDLLTLNEAVRRAAEDNFSVRMARNDARIAENDYSLGNAGFFPNLELRAQESRTSFGRVMENQAVFGAAHTVDVSMNLSTTLFDGGGQLATYRRLGSERELAMLEAARTTEAALADVIVAYYDLVRQQEQVEVQREAVSLSEERVRIASLRRDLGSASELEVRRAQVDLNADRAAQLRQEISLVDARADFHQLLGGDGSPTFSVEDTIRLDRTLLLDDLLAGAAAGNRTLERMRQARESAEFATAEERADWLPSIGLSAGYSFNDLTSQLGLPAGRAPGLNYGVTASWNVFDGFNRSRRIENAQVRLQNSELALEEASTYVGTRIESAYQNYRRSLDLVDLEQENVALASFNVQVALEQFRVGTITSVELREVQSAFTSAELRFITAQFEAARAQVELQQLSGRLLQQVGISP
jgi:outer membrane protein TolC